MTTFGCTLCPCGPPTQKLPTLTEWEGQKHPLTHPPKNGLPPWGKSCGVQQGLGATDTMTV